MTYKNAKTVLFASLIVAMILPFGMVDNSYADVEKSNKGELTRMAFEQTTTNEDDASAGNQEIDIISSEDTVGPVGNIGVVNDRIWATSPDDLINHQIFLNFTKSELSDNQWNQDMLKENIRNYNLETAIGVNVDGYELSTLYSQLEKLDNTYNPTNAEKKLHEWGFFRYDIPQELDEVIDRITEIVKTQDRTLVDQLVISVNKMTNYGNVSVEVHQIDPEFWSLVENRVLCDLIPSCDMVELNSIMDDSQVIFVTT